MVNSHLAQSPTVHPRLRGELLRQLTVIFWSYGSSPLARGTQSNLFMRMRINRFIPACAGNSLGIFESHAKPAVHPRLRGELSIFSSQNTIRDGSSPLARGTRLCLKMCLPTIRFIPACAGNSPSGNKRPKRDAVHPRLRGELNTYGNGYANDPGSSPLARGTPTLAHLGEQTIRFIPACAGNSLKMVTTLH